MRWIKGLILAAILLIVVLVGILFAVNNQQTIALNLIWLELPAVSLSVWLLATLVFGVILGMLAMLGVYVRLKATLARSQRQNKQQRKELDSLRTQEFKELACRAAKRTVGRHCHWLRVRLSPSLTPPTSHTSACGLVSRPLPGLLRRAELPA